MDKKSTRSGGGFKTSHDGIKTTKSTSHQQAQAACKAAKKGGK